MNTPPIFLVFGFLLVCPGFADTGAKNELRCMVDPKDLKNLKEALEEVRVGFVWTNKLSSLRDEFKNHKGSSDECKATLTNIFYAFDENGTEIIDLNKASNAERSVLQGRIKDTENTARNRFARQVENEEGMALSKLKTISARLDIERGQLESARDTFLSLEDREELIESLVIEAYSGVLSKLKNVIYFVSKINNHYSLASKALTTLFQEMKRHQHTNEKEEIFLMHYVLERIIDNINFQNQDLLIKYQITDLSYKTWPVVEMLFRDLENDIYAYNYEKTLKVIKIVSALAQREQELFAVDLAKQLFLNTNFNGSFSSFIKVGTQLPLESTCVYAQEIFHQLKNVDRPEAMARRQLWIFLHKMLLDNNGNSRSSDPRFQTCEVVLNRMGSTEAEYLEDYVTDVYDESNHNILYSRHREHPALMKNILYEIVIPYLNELRFTNLHLFLKLLKFIENIPHSETICRALGSIETRLNQHKLTLTAQNFYKMILARKQRDDCIGVSRSGPKVFEYLLETSTRKCKLISHYTSGYKRRSEPMYCPASYANLYINNDRPIFTRTNTKIDTDQYWHISLNSDGFIFKNFLHTTRYLTYFSNNDQAWGVYVPDYGTKTWRIEAADQTSRNIRIHTDTNRYLFSSGQLYDRDDESRLVRLRNGPAGDGDDVWHITCE